MKDICKKDHFYYNTAFALGLCPHTKQTVRRKKERKKEKRHSTGFCTHFNITGKSEWCKQKHDEDEVFLAMELQMFKPTLDLHLGPNQVQCIS